MSAALFCKVMGAVFLVVAAWGFIDGMKVLIFHVNTAHNVVHLLSGLGALACGFAGEKPARMFCYAFGAVYTLVAALGFLGVAQVIELLGLNTADNWLHAVLGIAFLAAGFVSAPKGAKIGPAGPPKPA